MKVPVKKTEGQAAERERMFMKDRPDRGCSENTAGAPVESISDGSGPSCWALPCPGGLSAAMESCVGAVWCGSDNHILPTPPTRGAHLIPGLGLIDSPYAPRDVSGTPAQ